MTEIIHSLVCIYPGSQKAEETGYQGRGERTWGEPGYKVPGERGENLGTRGEGREPGYQGRGERTWVPGERGGNLGTRGEGREPGYQGKELVCMRLNVYSVCTKNLHYQSNKLNHTEEYRQCTYLPLQNEKKNPHQGFI